MTTRQAWLAGAIGAVLWLLAALAIRHLSVIFDGGLKLLALFAVTIPAGWAMVDLLRRLTGVTPSSLLRAVAIALITACLLDGMALSYATGLYGPIASYTPFGSAWLLWAVGWTLFAALHRSRG